MPHEFPERIGYLELENIANVSKPHRTIAQPTVPTPKWKFRQYQQKTLKKQKLKPSRSAPPQTETRASPKYTTTDRRSTIGSANHHATPTQPRPGPPHAPNQPKHQISAETSYYAPEKQKLK